MQDIETSGCFNVELAPYISALPLLIKNGVIATVSTGYEYAGYVKQVRGLGALHGIS